MDYVAIYPIVVLLVCLRCDCLNEIGRWVGISLSVAPTWSNKWKNNQPKINTSVATINCTFYMRQWMCLHVAILLLLVLVVFFVQTSPT